MYLFNTTFLVNPLVLLSWQQWLKESYQEEIHRLGLTSGSEMFEVIAEQEDGSRTFSFQWRCSSMELLETLNGVSDELCGDLIGLFGDKCLYFSSVLKQVPSL